MEWPHANGSSSDLTLLLGEAVSNTRIIITDMRDVRNKVDFLMLENVQRKADHQSLLEKIEPDSEPPRGFMRMSVSEAMEKGSRAWEAGRQVFEALVTFKTTVGWCLSGTAIYKMISQPLEVKQFCLSFLAIFGLSF